ncbi:metallophosphoesterase [Spirulina sp. CCNP1310]|uniref:metallophosphoesterase n=1 Tax=Spirulina sp. CCNP1310 TaxID=3110249 RepID=UPI002B1FFCAA|nr:metallophosphoesterase [Spirulina sp. CCNP1310]MEA5418789.1 metallophosphoesterase [Spirulina sp. CCNP1310]
MSQIEPRWLEVKRVDLVLPRCDRILKDFKLVQISDLHVRSLHSNTLDRVVDQINAQAPDAVVITGDFVTKDDDLDADRPLLAPLKRLRAKQGVYGILGNHDHWTNPLIVRHFLRENQIRDLSNQAIALTPGATPLILAGIDDPWVGQPDLPGLLQRLPPEGCAILLAHEPNFADTAAQTRRFDLQLSGHSHGGQIRLHRFYNLPPMSDRYPSGQYPVGKMIQYTNRGIGMGGLPMRLRSRPEITVLHIQGQAPNSLGEKISHFIKTRDENP